MTIRLKLSYFDNVQNQSYPDQSWDLISMPEEATANNSACIPDTTKK